MCCISGGPLNHEPNRCRQRAFHNRYPPETAGTFPVMQSVWSRARKRTAPDGRWPLLRFWAPSCGAVVFGRSGKRGSFPESVRSGGPVHSGMPGLSGRGHRLCHSDAL